MSNTKQVKTKKRVTDHGEVFTSDREVNAMLDLVKQETERIDSRFLEPACGNGNFLTEIIKRKLEIVDSRYGKSQLEWEKYALIAVTSIYGVDILEDNTQECQNRLYNLVSNAYIQKFGTKCKVEFLTSIKFILSKNIIWGDATNYCIPNTSKPIIFCEWTPIGDLIQRKDWVFEFLAEGSYQISIFDENNEPQHFDKSIKEYKPVHFLKLG
jgi:hypothetical protein